MTRILARNASPHRSLNRDRAIGRGEPVLIRYERVTFEKSLISLQGKPPTAFLCPGHPLLDATIDLVIERHRDLLKRGAILVDEADDSDQVCVLAYLEHSIQDARTDKGNRRVVSRRLQFVEIDQAGTAKAAGPAPYLNYRPLIDAEQALVAAFARMRAEGPQAAPAPTPAFLRMRLRE